MSPDEFTLNAIPPIEELTDREWRPVNGLERLFSVSNRGDVYSWWWERLVAPKFNRSTNTASVRLHGKSLGLGRLVWTIFRGDIPKSMYLGFKNDDHSDVRLDNLELHSLAELQRESYRPRTKCNLGHELSEFRGKRRCLTCKPLKSVIEPN